MLDRPSFKSLKTEWGSGPAIGSFSQKRRLICIVEEKANASLPLSIALAFELLTPNRVCLLFSRALRRPVRFVYSPVIEIETKIPDGYVEQLRALEILFGKLKAPYFGSELKGVNKEASGVDGWNGDGSGGAGGEGTVVEEARALWGGWRGIEEYAREVFPVEEAANGQTWMNDDT